MSDSKSLRQTLEVAGSGQRDAVMDFLRCFLASSIFVPLRLKQGEGASSGALHANTQYILVERDGHKTLPVFSDAKLIAEWAGREVPYEECGVRALLWNVDENVCIHLNPGQEIGKEFSTWEIAQLRLGDEAIGEIADELCETENTDFEVLGIEIPETLRKRLAVLFESYEAVKEAFFLVMRSCQDQVSSPVIGLKLAEIQSAKLQMLLAEIRQEVSSNEDLGSVMGDVAIFDDLASELSPNRKIFQDVIPFYFASKTFNLEPKTPSIIGDLKNLFRKESK